MVAQLDYVLSDALTFPEKDGRRVELWRPGLRFDDPQDFMDRYTEFHVQVISREPIESWPTPRTCRPSSPRITMPCGRRRGCERIIDAAIEHGVAIEISSWRGCPA